MYLSKLKKCVINNNIIYSDKFIKKTIISLFWISVLLGVGVSVVQAEECVAVDCILSPWVHWSHCSHSCGDSGVKTRYRTVLQNATCGGSCTGETAESLPCNRKCCPVDCMFTNWGKWKKCACEDGKSCGGNLGARVSCVRERYKVINASCGGTCNGETYEIKCGSLCCYQNCLETPWMEWGPCIGRCEQKGIQERIKTILIQPRCGGKPCSDGLEQRECLVGCCPVNCSLGEWSDWSVCNNTCGHGNMTRTRAVIQAKCGGTECPKGADTESKNCTKYVDVNCVVGTWSGWTNCLLDNGKCGVGKRNRSRIIMTDVGCRGAACPPLLDVTVCHGPCCRHDCEVTQWTEWGYCSTDCGKGIRNRTREITKPASCNGTACPVVMENEPCVVNQTVNCKLTEWSSWSECSNSCGQGEQYRSRSMQTPAYCGGEACKNITLEDKTNCTSYRARKDCQVSEWEEWGECTHNCGSGLQRRNRTILSNAVCNGTKCSVVTLSEWGNWGECIRNCDRGEQKRLRKIASVEVCEGKPCGIRAEVRNCHEKCLDDQDCNQGVCSCKEGKYKSKTSGKCLPVMCSYPKLSLECPNTHTKSVNCKSPDFICTGVIYNKTCTATCGRYPNWVLKGSPAVIRCKASGKWTPSQLFCTPANHPPTGIKLDKTKIIDGSPEGLTVSYMSTEDPDKLDHHVYKLIEDKTNRLKVIGNKLILTKNVDYEIPPIRWNITVSSTDIENKTVTATFEMTIEDKNDPPSAAFLVPDSIPENSPAGTFVGCLSAEDEESKNNLTIVLVNSEHKTFSSYKMDNKTCIQVEKVSDPRCEINGGKYCVLNREKRVRHSITVMVTDRGQPPLTSYFDLSIGLTDVNDRPSNIQLNPAKIPEEYEAGEVLAEVVTVDEDKTQTFTLELLDDPSGLFSLSGNKLVASKKFDHETEKSSVFNIKVKTTDSGTPPLSFNTTVKVKIGDVNEAPYDLHLTSSNAAVTFFEDKPQIRENVDGILLGTLVVKDHDKDDTVKLSLPVDAGGRLHISSQKCSSVGTVAVFCTASLMCSKQFDYEAEKQVNISVMAVDRKNLQTVLNLTIEILDVNDEPQDILMDGKAARELTVQENLNGEIIGTLSAVDQDVEDSHTFFLVKSDGGRFVVDGALLKTSGSANLDYEKATEHTVTVMTEDSGSPALHLTKSFKIKVQDVNEAPATISLSNVKVPENSTPGRVVGTMAVSDPDNAVSSMQTFTFHLVNDGKGRFTMTGDTLKVASSIIRCGLHLCDLDYETENMIEIAVNVTDSGTPPLSKYQRFTVLVEDANDPPRDIRIVGGAIRENEPPGANIGQITATEEDFGQVVTFTLMDNKDIFDIKDSSLITKVTLDYEKQSVYNVTIKSTDNGSPAASSDAVIQVEILDVNEAPVYSGETTFTTKESTDVLTSIGLLRATDPDNSEKLQITATDNSNQFLVTNTTCQSMEPSGTECVGHLTLASDLNYEKQMEYNITITVQDRRGFSVSPNITVKVLDENDPPQDILLNGKSVTSVTLEENSHGSVIGQLQAADPDVGQTHLFTLVFDGDGQFVIQGNTLKTAVNATLDYEDKQEYTLEIKAEDSGKPALVYEKSLTVTVVDVNEKPTKVSLSSSQVEENSAQGTVVGRLQVEDPDNVKVTTQTFSFVLVDTAGGKFKVIGDELQVARSNTDCLMLGGDYCDINFESTRSHTVKVQVTDSGVPSQSRMFSLSVQVADANDPPRNIRLSNYKINSTAAGGAEVGRFSVTDEDTEQTHSYTLTNDSNGLFAVSSSGILTKVKDNTLDVKQLYVIKVKVTDDGNPQKETEESFIITAVPSKDTNIQVTFISEGSDLTFNPNKPVVKENSPKGTVIGSLVAEENLPDQQLTFQVQTKSGGTEVVKLDSKINCQTQKQKTKCQVKVLSDSPLNFEVTPDITLIVQVTGQGDKSVTDVVTLRVEDVNEPPEALEHTGQSLSVQENLNGKTIALFSAYDQDSGDDSLKFEMVNDGDGKFVLGQGGQLSTSDADINYEEVKSVNITVRVTDSGGLSMERNFTVHIVDVNERPANVTLTKNKVNEMSPVGTEVGALQGTDPDKGQVITYTMLQDAQGRFVIEGSKLKVKSVGDHCKEKGGSFCLLDFETQNTYDIVVKATDNGTPSLDSTFTLTVEVQDVNDAPTDLTLTSSPLTEDSEINKTVGILQAKDVDKGQTITYSIASGVNTGVFAVEENKILLKQSLDYEYVPSYQLTVEASDSGKPPLKISKEFTISVVDVNEAPTGFVIEPKTGATEYFKENHPIVLENKEYGTLIGQLVIHDPDTLDSVKFFTTSTDVALFNQQCVPLNKGVRCSSDVRSARVFDFESTPSVQLLFDARDKQGVVVSVTVTLTVKDTNDPPTDIIINNSSATTLSLSEGSQDMTLANLTTVDVDSGQSHSFTLLTNTKAFYVSGQQLKVTASAELDYESEQIYKLKLRSTDSGNPPYHTDKTITIQITDVNEKPTDVKLSRNQIPENCEAGFEVGSLMTSDPDNSMLQQQTFVYSLTDNAGGRFMLDGAVLKVNNSDFDFETKDSYVITVKVTDSGSPALSTEVKVKLDVIDANDPPRDLKFTGKTVKENSAIGVEVGRLSAVDSDAGQKLTYSLTSTDNFRVVANAVLVNGILDFELYPLVTIEVKVQDNGFPPLSMTRNFTVHVTDEDEAPSRLIFVTSDTIKNMKIKEDTKIGKVVGQIEARDPDHSDRLQLTLGSDDKGYFELSSPNSCSQKIIVQQKKKITVTNCVVDVKLMKTLDYENEDDRQLTFAVKATDQGGKSIENEWSLEVVNSNEPPRDVTIDGTVTSIPENLPNFTIGALQTEDEDTSDTHLYHILSHWDIFHVHMGILKVKKPLDYEKKDKYMVSIKSIDNGIPSMSFVKDFTFTVEDVNEKPSQITLSHTEVNNAAAVGDVIGYVKVVDPDNEGRDPPVQTHNCTVGGDGLGVFSINSTEDGSKVMQVAKAIPVDTSVLPIQITCTDSGYPPLSLTVDFKLSVNETITIPKDLALKDEKSVPENTAGDFVVGTMVIVNVLNQEAVSGTFTYTLNDPSIPFKIVGDKLQVSKPLNFEEKSEWAVVILATGTDANGKTINIKKTFSVDVTDVNEAPYAVNIYGGGFVTENSDQGTVIGDLNTMDVEKYQTYTYKIMAVSQGLDISSASDGMLGAFQLSGRTLQVGTNASAINYESSKHITVLVQSTDSGSPPLSYNGTIHLIVQDTNDVPSQIFLNNTQVSENSPAGTVVGELTVIDEDEGQTHICHVQNSRDTPFQVVHKLYITVSREELDFEKTRKYAVEIECMDHGSDDSSLTATKTFLIDVTNVNEPPYDIKMAVSSIRENNNVGQEVGEITATDPDGDPVTFSIVGESVFAVEGDSTLIANNVLDYEVKHEYRVTLKVKDTQGLSTQSTLDIQVVDINEAPTDVQLDHTTAKENLGQSEVIGTLTTVDEDRGQTFVYAVREMDSDFFAIDGDKLVTGKTVLDYEKNDEHHIFINSTDSGNPAQTIQKEFVIRVEDINEAPEGIIIGSLPPVKENTPVNTVLTTVQVDDPDANSDHVCHVTEPLSVVTNAKKEMTLVLAGSVDYEKQAQYTLSLMCSDGRSEIKKVINITIEDVNEPPKYIKLSGTRTVVADASPGYVIGDLSVLDPDLNQKHTFSLSGPNSDILQVNENKQLTLIAKISQEELSKDNPTLVINITASDNGVPSLSKTSTFKIPITDIQVEAENLPVITLGNTEVTEDATAGKVVGALYNTNLTIGDNVVFEVKQNPDGLFMIKNNKYLVLAKNLTEIEGISRKVTLMVRNKETFQTSEKVITVFIVRVDNCKRGHNETCNENGRCIAVNETVHKCHCETGYSGDGYTCENINDCVIKDDQGEVTPGNPCKNNGQCIDDINDFSCICKKGFTGPNCEISTTKQNPCLSEPCKNFGNCFPDEKNDTVFQCFCQGGWTGSVCSVNIDDCKQARCYGGGKCIDKIQTYVCSCTEGRYGVRCQYLVSSCQVKHCDLSKDEVCVPVVNKDKGICAVKSLDTVKLTVQRGPEQFDADEFKAKIMDRIVEFCNRAGPKPAFGRKRRDTTEKASDSVQVYIVSVKEVADGLVDVEFMVIDVQDVPYTKQEVMDLLVSTCTQLKTTSNEDKEVCPAVMNTVKKVDDDGAGSEDAGSLAPVIGGAAAGVVVLIVMVIVIVVVKKRRKNEGNAADSGHSMSKLSTEDSETVSRRSSGYASISKAPGTPQLGRANQEVQEIPSSSNMEMSTDLDFS